MRGGPGTGIQRGMLCEQEGMQRQLLGFVRASAARSGAAIGAAVRAPRSMQKLVILT